MKTKFRNIGAEECGISTLGNLSNNKFVKDYYDLVKPYLHDEFSGQFPKSPSVEDLRSLAEKEFFNCYGKFPTCAVFAPGYISLTGKSRGLAESKSLSMAIQLVTLIVGKRSNGSKWCHVKTLTDEIDGEKSFRFYLNPENLQVSTEDASWIRYLKATIQCFKAKRARVPGFEIVIVSSVPVKRGLGSSSALVVAFYTFLEAITNMQTGNLLEKTLACHLAEKLAVESHDHRIVDALASIVGVEEKIFTFDARSLNIDVCDWNSLQVELIVIECVDPDTMEPPKSHNAGCHKESFTIMNMMSRWRTHPDGILMMERLISREMINMAKNVINKDERVSKMVDTIRADRWDEFGKLLWENYHSARKYLSSLPDDIERIMTVLKTTEGILGASVIVGRSHSASVVALVQRSKLKSFIPLLNRMKVSQQRYYRVRSFMGASTLYTYERHSLSWNETKHRCYRRKCITKYHLRDEDSFKLNAYNVDFTKTISLFIPHESLFD